MKLAKSIVAVARSLCHPVLEFVESCLSFSCVRTFTLEATKNKI